MRTAEKIAGSREKLAERLGVAPYLVAEWIARITDAPDEIVHMAVEIILEHRSRS